MTANVCVGNVKYRKWGMTIYERDDDGGEEQVNEA